MVWPMARPLTRLQGQRVALVTNIPRPYRIPLYETLSQQIVRQGGMFKVLFYSDPQRHARRQEAHTPPGQFASASVAGLEIPLGYERILALPTALLPTLQRDRPTAVISGTFGPVGYLTWLYTRMTGIPYIQWSGATCVTEGPGLSRARLTQGWLARRARSSITYGTAARDYLVQLGARHERVVVGVNTVDTAWFAHEAYQAQARAAQLKAQHGLAGVQLLYVGSLIERKGLGRVLEALAHVDQSLSWQLHIVGGGPDEDALQARAATLGLLPHMHFWGAQPSSQLPLFYALADVFLFPSLEEVWGLVLNEAMACGLAVVASSRAGATFDLVKSGVNGLVVDPERTSDLADIITTLVEDASLRARLGAAAVTTIQQRATLDHSAAAFLRALDLALA